MSRISTAASFDTGVATLQKRQRELTDAQQQLSSGKRIAHLSDDPSATARAERALAAQARSDADQRALDASRSGLVQIESAFGDAGELLQQARELLVAAGNPSYGAAERQGLSERLAGIRQQLLQIANRGDGAGGYLFGGQGIGAPPFIDAPGGVQYGASAGTQQAASSETLPLTSDGQRAWLAARSGNGVFETAATTSNGAAWIDAGRVTQPDQLTGLPYSVTFTVTGAGTSYTVLQGASATALTGVPYQSGQAIQLDGMSFAVTGQPADGDRFDILPATPELSVFDTLDRLAVSLANGAAGPAQVSQAVADGLRDLDSSAATLNGQRADAGAWLNRLDAVESRVAGQKLRAQGERSAAEDLDMVQAISDFQLQQTSYDAALRAYSTVQRLSLFQYL
jgi:flagellar hook-associated protein 3 FlgL